MGSLTNWQSVVGSGGASSIAGGTAATKTDGTLWTWGLNGNGQLGLGDVVNRSSPVQVGLLTNWRSVSSGSNQTAATKTDGTLWTWGYNFAGQLGIGSIVSQSSPTQVVSLTNWKQASAGAQALVALYWPQTTGL